MAWTAPRTYTTGELITAAILNTHIRDDLKYLKGLSGAITIDADIVTAFNVDGVDISGHEGRHVSGGADAFDSPIAVVAMADLAENRYWRGNGSNRPVEL